MSRLDAPRDLVRTRTVDAELGALLWLLVEGRTPLVAVGRSTDATALVVDALAAFLPAGTRLVTIAPDDEFGRLPEAGELGWRSTDATPAAADRPPPAASDTVLVVRSLGAPDGIGGARARIVVRALAVGYGLLATMDGDGLDDALNTLHGPPIETDPDERSRLGVVLAVGLDAGTPRVTAAHYVRPVAFDTHGHVQRPAPAVLATWNDAATRFDHFAWGVLPDLAGRLGMRPIDLEREQARRAAELRG